MAEIKWILTCNMECEDESADGHSLSLSTLLASGGCPQGCPKATYEKEQLNTEVPSDG